MYPRRKETESKDFGCTFARAVMVSPSTSSVNNEYLSSSKILHVLRQALLNAADELISQQEDSPPHTLAMTTDGSDRARPQNGNAIKKKAPPPKKKKKNAGRKTSKVPTRQRRT